ncbi:MAG: hypothetical protein K6G43_00225 [Lachnospiraceae bacterium]|nr:hypothetical protein [Lachnospiraceae bacterium]
MYKKISAHFVCGASIGEIRIRAFISNGVVYLNHLGWPCSKRFFNAEKSLLSPGEFEQKIAALKIEDWDESYVCQEYLYDGLSWSVELCMDDGSVKKSGGWEAFPGNWDYFGAFLQQLSTQLFINLNNSNLFNEIISDKWHIL